jgi:hypothetical protein
MIGAPFRPVSPAFFYEFATFIVSEFTRLDARAAVAIQKVISLARK